MKHKILSANEIKARIGSRPRSKTVGMCHGTFDIVHPGHVRHLMYAKEHCDILIASITCDQHVTKANFRPYVNEHLRAMNLSAFEMVDYVLIDTEPTCLTNLGFLQPDLFAKGFEYQVGHLITDVETEIVRGYGGEMLFTPGDVVFSSSAIINASPPNLAVEGLLTTMEANGLTFDELRSTVALMAGKRAHVVGDTIIDTITETVPTGAIGKTPTISVQVQSVKNFIGGAAIVAKHMKAAGAHVVFSTVIGDDKNGVFLVNDLIEAGIDLRHEVDHGRPTTNKNAFVAAGYRMLKVDTLDNRPVPFDIVQAIAADIASSNADAVLFCDFRHGLFSKQSIPMLTAAIPDGAYRVADSQVASRWGNILDFQGFDLITPNEKEARFSLGDQDTVIRPLASRLYAEAKCKTLALKMGDRGVLLQTGGVGDAGYLHAVPSFVNRLVDPVGAGDALVAYASLGNLVSGNPVIGAILGSIAAALECEVDGNVPIDAALVTDRISALERQAYPGRDLMAASLPSAARIFS